LVFPEPADDPKFIQKLRKEERSLYKAYRGFLRAGFQGALRGGFDPVIPRVEAKYMGPVVKDEVVKALQEDMINVWSILSAIFPYELGGVTGNESDNQLLSIAENAEDPILQEAIFSHIEVLIELEAIEIRQEALGLKKEKKKIVKQYNEMKYMREKVINTYVEKLEKHKFPIDARKLMTNYLKAASKAPQKAFQTLTSNPAMFAPIEIDKMPKKLFGLIKPSPKDARNMNKKIARFLKKAKP
jgi:hypothetical protein